MVCGMTDSGCATKAGSLLHITDCRQRSADTRSPRLGVPPMNLGWVVERAPQCRSRLSPARQALSRVDTIAPHFHHLTDAPWRPERGPGLCHLGTVPALFLAAG